MFDRALPVYSNKWPPPSERYYQTAFDQLSVGLLAEKDDDARNAIRTALGRLVELDPATALAKLEAINRTLRDALAESCCKFFVARGMNTLEEVPDAVWEEAEEVTSYDRQALTGLLQILPKDNLVAALTAATRACRTIGKSDNDDYRAKLELNWVKAQSVCDQISSRSVKCFFCLRAKEGKPLPPVRLLASKRQDLSPLHFWSAENFVICKSAKSPDPSFVKPISPARI